MPFTSPSHARGTHTRPLMLTESCVDCQKEISFVAVAVVAVFVIHSFFFFRFTLNVSAGLLLWRPLLPALRER